jgi:hypothetical protein
MRTVAKGKWERKKKIGKRGKGRGNPKIPSEILSGEWSRHPM